MKMFLYFAYATNKQDILNQRTLILWDKIIYFFRSSGSETHFSQGQLYVRLISIFSPSLPYLSQPFLEPDTHFCQLAVQRGYQIEMPLSSDASVLTTWLSAPQQIIVYSWPETDKGGEKESAKKIH